MLKQLETGARRISLTTNIRAYKRQAKQQKAMIKKARQCERQLLYIVSAFRELVKDENFINLLRAEDMNSMPTYLSEKITEVTT